MAKVNIAQDADKARLKQRYTAAVNRLQEIEDNAETYLVAELRTALKDLSRIQGDALKLLRKVVEKEI